jgi:hypothetical protein
MRKFLMVAAAVAMLGSISTTASAQKIDKNGRCHDKAGKFAKADVCAGVKGSPPSSAAAPAAVAAADPKVPYKLDAKGKCHDVKGKMAAKAKCAA